MSTPGPGPLCADTARDRGDPQVGTALHLRRFLLVEHAGPWPFHALDTPELADVVGDLVEATRAATARTLLVRRPGRPDPTRRDGPRAWAVVDVAAGLARWGTWDVADDLLAARDLLAEPSTDADGRPRGGWTCDPVVLVCAHGRHDACCAVRGRPVAADLAAVHGDRVWECSHVGGDRFAANVVVLPDGTFYGGVGDAGLDAVGVVEDHLAGRVRVAALRGTSTLPPVAQAAAVAVHERWGPAGARDVVDAVVVPTADPDRWDVELRCRGPLPGLVRATVSAHVREPAVLTCRAPRATSARTYEVDGLHEVVEVDAGVRGT